LFADAVLFVSSGLLRFLFFSPAVDIVLDEDEDKKHKDTKDTTTQKRKGKKIKPQSYKDK
jgi:hypothetical protein